MAEVINILVHSEGQLDSEIVKIGKNNNKSIFYENMKLNIKENKKFPNDSDTNKTEENKKETETKLDKTEENKRENETNSNQTEENKQINETNENKTEENKKINENKEEEEKEEGKDNNKKTSISGAIFAMTSLSIGTGCLTFTKKVIQFGFVWFGVTLIIGGIATYWTLCGLIRAAKKKNDSEYSSIVRKELGNFPAVLVDIMTCLYSWGLIITYEIIMNSLVGRVIYVFFKNKEIYPTFILYESQEWNTIQNKIFVLGAINLLLVVLCLVKDIGRMKFFSLFGIIALFYTITVLVIESPFYWKHYLKNVYQKNDKSTHANWIDISKAFNNNLDFFTGFATIVFSFSNHQGALPVYRSLKPNNEQPVMNKVFRRSIILDLIIYFLIYIASFLTSPLISEDLIIFRESIFKNDIFMNLAKISIFLELFFLVPSNYNSFRCSLFHILFGNENIRSIPNIILTLSTLIISAIIGVVYSEISNYISLLGGFCCTTYCYFIPGWLMIKVEWNEMSKTKRILSIIGISILTLFGYIGGIMSVIICIRGRK